MRISPLHFNALLSVLSILVAHTAQYIREIVTSGGETTCGYIYVLVPLPLCVRTHSHRIRSNEQALQE
jgi:hypothetical protein